MKIIDILKQNFSEAYDAAEDKRRISKIVVIISYAILLGLAVVLLYRVPSGVGRQTVAMVIAGVMVTASLVLLRRGLVELATVILTWTLLGFIEFMIWESDGLHDTGILALPGILVIASLTLNRRHFIAIVAIVLALVGLLGYFEIRGVIVNRFASGTDAYDVLDLTVILAITAVTVRLLTDMYTKSFEAVRKSETEIRTFADRLKLSEDRHRMLFESANDSILILAGERFIDCNFTSVTMFGCGSREDLVGRSPWDFSPRVQPDGENSRQKASKIMLSALNGESQRFVWQHVRRDGTLFDAEISLNRLEAGNELLLQAIVRDVTERNRMEERIRRSEVYYRTLVEASPEAIIIIDTHGRVEYASTRAYELFGAPKEMPLSKNSVFDWVVPDDRAMVFTKIGDAVAGKSRPHSQEYRLVRDDGTMFWAEVAAAPFFDDNGEVSRLLLLCHDISERREALQALRESEERFSRLSEATFEGIVVSKGGIIIDSNMQFERMLGYGQGDTIGKEVSAFVAPESRTQVAENIRSQSEVPYEHLALRKDGSVFPVEIRAKTVAANGHSLRLTAVRDMTERKKMEEDLRIVWRAAEQSPASIVITDTSGAIQYVNPAFTEVSGYSLDEVLGKNPRILKSGITSPEEYARLWETISYGGVWHGKFANKKKNGEIYWESASISGVTNEQGIITHYVAVKMDITDQKKMEDALRTSEQRYRNLMEHSPDGVYKTTHDGKFVELNQAMVNMLGYDSKEELMAVDIASDLYFNRGDREKAVANEQRGQMAIFRLKKKDGTEVWVEDHGRYVAGENNTIAYHEGILRDITQRLKGEEERKKLEHQLYQSQKFESIGTLASGIAHDFNNMLNIIRGNTDLLRQSAGMNDKNEHRLEKISKAADHGTQLVKQLLTFARKTEFVKRSVMINDLIREIAGLLEETFPKNISLILALTPQPVKTVADSGQIHQVLVNLCVNARDAMPDGGSITITTARVSSDTVRERFLSASDGRYVSISVKDTGMGMDEETRKKIFDPFFTTKTPEKGTGLGLSVVMRIVSKHNGFIDVHSAPGNGSEFMIYLPEDPDAA
ncbi:MAG TPA: PAS domain S-box protein [Bacteroidota bacterium]|nr:PAS domain S-box protein [Bacteroidota bacterium]